MGLNPSILRAPIAEIGNSPASMKSVIFDVFAKYDVLFPSHAGQSYLILFMTPDSYPYLFSWHKTSVFKKKQSFIIPDEQGVSSSPRPMARQALPGFWITSINVTAGSVWGVLTA